MQPTLSSIYRDKLILTKNLPLKRTTTSFCMTLKGSNTAAPTPLVMSIDSSRNGAIRAAPLRINSTLCGEDHLGGDLGPSSLLLGCVRSRPGLVGVHLREETRTYSVSPTIPEVRSLLCYYTSYAPDVCSVGMESVPVVVVFTKYDRLESSKRVELQEDDNSLSEDLLRDRSKEEAQKVLDGCIQSLKAAADTLSDVGTPHHVSVSGIIFPLFIRSVLILLPSQPGLRS